MKILILGGGGFIGSNLAKRLKSDGNYVRIVDLKYSEYLKPEYICDEFIIGDLRDPLMVSRVVFGPNQQSESDKENSFDEVYQLAADMGGAQFIFTGENDADIMHNSALINLNVAHEAVKKSVKKLFYSSSACIYPAYNQEDPDNPNCKENSAIPAAPDSCYGWEKICSEFLYDAHRRNYGLNVRTARYHNVFGILGCWCGGREKAPAAICRKVAEAPDGGEIEIWGDGKQTRSFLYIDECVEATIRLMRSDCTDILNIGSEEMVTINQLAEMAIGISGKDIKIKNIPGPTGVRGRNSDNTLYREKIGWEVSQPLIEGLKKTYSWIENQITNRK
jgi:nucleoside-diphosphate-sugar epimerase